MDILFIEFYIKKIYNKSLKEYFNVSSPVVSRWRKKSLPGNRLKEFFQKEETIDYYVLFERIYPKKS